MIILEFCLCDMPSALFGCFSGFTGPSLTTLDWYPVASNLGEDRLYYPGISNKGSELSLLILAGQIQVLCLSLNKALLSLVMRGHIPGHRLSSWSPYYWNLRNWEEEAPPGKLINRKGGGVKGQRTKIHCPRGTSDLEMHLISSKQTSLFPWSPKYISEFIPLITMPCVPSVQGPSTMHPWCLCSLITFLFWTLSHTLSVQSALLVLTFEQDRWVYWICLNIFPRVHSADSSVPRHLKMKLIPNASGYICQVSWGVFP